MNSTASKPELTLHTKRNGRKATITVKTGDTPVACESLDLTKPDERKRFAKSLASEQPGIDCEAVEAELLHVAAESQDSEPKNSQADLLVELATQKGVELFHTPGGHDSQGYATIPVNDHFETWPIQSGGFRRWLGRQF